MSEQTSNPTSGQNVPKSKFRRKSRQEQTAASKLRMERRGEKLDAAREKLAKQKPPKKPGAVKRLAHTAGHGVHGFVHGKLYEVEHENVGTEGAHRSELAAEQALIADRMAEAGISNMGAYMRKIALNGYVLHVDLSDIRELVALQRRCANNLNQVAVHANTYGIYPSEIAALQKDYADLWEPLSDLLKKLSAVVNL